MGTALALFLRDLGQQVRLWSYDASHIERLSTDRVNTRYLPGHVFPDNLQPISTLEHAIASVQDILIAVPSVGFRSTLTTLKTFVNSEDTTHLGHQRHGR